MRQPSIPLYTEAGDMAFILLRYPGQVVCQRSGLLTSHTLHDSSFDLPAFEHVIDAKFFSSVRSANILRLATSSVTNSLRNSHEDGTLFRPGKASQFHLVFVPTTQEDTACLHRNLRQKCLARKIHACKKFHVVKHPPAHALHLFARIAEDAVGYNNGHYTGARLEKLITGFDE